MPLPKDADVLVNRKRTGHLHEIVSHEGVRTVALLVAVVTLGITRYGCGQVDFWQKVRLESAILPIGGFQLVQCYGGIDTLYSCQSN